MSIGQNSFRSKGFYWLFLISTFVLIALGVTSCDNLKVRDKIKKNSQWIVENLYSDSVYKYFPEKYFDREKIHDLIAEFRNRCPKEQMSGGFKNNIYHTRLQGDDEALFIYEYQCRLEKVRIQVGYIIKQDSFEVAELSLIYQ